MPMRPFERFSDWRTENILKSEALLLKAALLDHGSDVKPCHIGMGVII
jgi:hypothetical protein